MTEFGVEYGRYKGVLEYEHVLRGPASVVRIAGSWKFENAPTLGLRANVGILGRSARRTLSGQAGFGMALLRLHPIDELHAERPSPQHLSGTPYVFEFEGRMRGSVARDVLFAELALVAHTLFSHMQFEAGDLRGTAIHSDWGVGPRVGAGVTFPIHGPWRGGWMGSGALMTRGLPFVALRAFHLFFVSWEQDIR